MQMAGRNGMHKDNNQDHSMVTAMRAVRNLLGDRVDVWAVNADDEDHETIDAPEDTITAGELRGLASSQPAVPRVAPMIDG